MTAIDLYSIWKSLDSEKVQKDTALQLVKKQMRRSRTGAALLGLGGVHLTLCSGVCLWAIITKKSDLALAWPSLVFLALFWATFILILRIRFQMNERSLRLQHKLPAWLGWSHVQATTAARELKIIMGSNLFIAAPAAVINVFILVNANLMTPREAICFSAFSATLLILHFSVLALYRAKIVLPLRIRLEQRIQSLEMADATIQPA
jgi:hypothetical protein